MVLVVDDHEESAYVLKRLLMIEGYEAVTATSGPAALDFLRKNPFTLVILDYHMPGMDGLAVFRAMQSDTALKPIPVIFFSAHDGDVMNAALNEGAAAWVIKGSLDASGLFRHIVRLIGPAPGSRDAADQGPTGRALDVG